MGNPSGFALGIFLGLRLYIIVYPSSHQNTDTIRSSVRFFICLSVCSRLRYYSNVFLPPIPEAGCPKESLEKSNRKKWSQILILLLIMDVKLLYKKKLFLGKFCLSEQDFFLSVLFNGLFAPTFQSLMSF